LKFYGVSNKQNIDRRIFGNDGEFALQYLKEHGPDIVRSDCLGKDKDLNQLVQEWLKVISPGVNASVDINKMLNVSELRFQFTEGKERTNLYRCVNVGFGLTYVLPIIVSLLSAQTGDVIILENPEAHIHPAGQRKLGELIGMVGQSGAQIIVETHSDHIMNGIRIATRKGLLDKDNTNFVYFYKDETDDYRHKCVIPHMDNRGKFDQWPEGFFDEWDNSLMDLL
jgi:predicted ATPase